MNGCIDVMASPAWSRLMRYVSRRLTVGLRSLLGRDTADLRDVVVDLSADVQVDLASVLARTTVVRSLYRLADRAIVKHLDRHRRRLRRRTLGLEHIEEPTAPEPEVDLPGPRAPIEKAPGWNLLRGMRERAIVRGVARGQTLAAVSAQQAWSLKETRRVAGELPAKLTQRRHATR